MYVVIIGGGQVGSYMADLLKKNKIDFVVVDSVRTNIEKLAKKFGDEHVCLGDGTDPNILASVKIETADVVTCVTGRDEINLVASTIAKFEFQCSRVVARVNNPSNAWLFNIGMGVDAAINEADIIGHIVVEEMSMKNFMTLMKLSKGDHSIIQLVVNEESEAAGKKIKDLKLPKSVLLIAIYHGEDFVVPNGETTIFPGDRIMLFSSEAIYQELVRIFSGSGRQE